MELSQLLDLTNVIVGVDASDKDTLIHAVIDLIADRDEVTDADRMREAIIERESTMSTGVGKGLGLPHAKTSAVNGILAALAVTQAPVDFASMDNEPVRIVFLLVGTQDAKSQHVRILSRISRMMNQNDARERVLAAGSTEELLDVIQDIESQLN
jgi:mannitol/fructose-specific phosphotransferase system IIA component (Ntr-type)